MIQKAEDWKPSRASKYYNCLRYEQTKELCPLIRALCFTCEFYNPPQEDSGRPNFTGVNWEDPLERNEYSRQSAIEYRKILLLKNFKSKVIHAAGDVASIWYQCPECESWGQTKNMVINSGFKGCRSCFFKVKVFSKKK